MPQEIYRQTALERLSSPERLDTLMTVTTPRGWLALIAACVAIAGALVWGFLGRAPDTISGSGILYRRGGLFEVQSLGSGIISALPVKPGDLVERDQIVARIAQPELERSIAQSEARLADFRKLGSTSGTLIRGNRDLEIVAIREQLVQIDQEQRTAEAQLAYLQERLKAQDEAVRLGLINRDLYQATSQEIARSRNAIDAGRARKTQLEARVDALRNQADQNLFTLSQQVESEQHQLELLRLQYDRSAFVRSPYRGRVIELHIDEGSTVMAGLSLLAVELQDQQLDCYVFVPLEGKRVNPGMRAHVTPTGVNWEEYGYIVGTVRAVSEAPLSPTAMNVYLRNMTLVQQFSEQGGAYLVQVDLEEDPSTASGLKWTSHRGPALHFGGGTLLTASIIVREQRPITFVVPALRRWLGI